MKRAETLLRCGIIIQVHEKFAQLDDLNQASRKALRAWSQKQPLEAERKEVLAGHQSIQRELGRAREKRRSSFNDSSIKKLRGELAVTGARMEELTNNRREGWLYCNLPKFVL